MEQNGCRIADAMNTYNTALKVIEAKGYKVFLYPDCREEYLGDFWAIKDSREFIGSDPLRLLGVISIWENTGDNWQQNNLPKENVYDKILSRAFPDSVEDYNILSENEFKTLVADYQLFFERIGFDTKIPNNITREDLYKLIDSFYL